MLRGLSVSLLILHAFAFAQAHATLGTITLPTNQEGLPDPNPYFDQFQNITGNPYVYPYTMRTNFTSK